MSVNVVFEKQETNVSIRFFLNFCLGDHFFEESMLPALILYKYQELFHAPLYYVPNTTCT